MSFFVDMNDLLQLLPVALEKQNAQATKNGKCKDHPKGHVPALRESFCCCTIGGAEYLLGDAWDLANLSNDCWIVLFGRSENAQAVNEEERTPAAAPITGPSSCGFRPRGRVAAAM